MSPTEKKHIRTRMILVAVIFVAIFMLIGGKAAYLQILRGEWLSQMAAGQYEKSFRASGKRGTIYDTNQAELAVSIRVTSIAAYPPEIDNPKITAGILAKALKLKKKELERKLSSEKSFVWIKRKVTPKEKERVENLKPKGIGFIPAYNRFYPNKALAAQIIGFTGTDSTGLEGIEYFYDSYLKGESWDITVMKDALGHGFISDRKRVPDYSGNNIILTIDKTVQYLSERALKDAVDKFSAQSGIAIVMNPKTGAILAMAHYPFFNPNSFKSSQREFWRNRAITDPFEPGSTMKVFSATAAVESGGFSPNSIFFCENGKYKIGKNVVHDLSSHGWLSLQQIIKYSSNIGAVKVGEMVGPERLYNTLRDFGFGDRTGIDCPGETAGSMTFYKQWSRLDTGAISFGHGISVSPLQLVSAVSAIANRGNLMKPYLVKGISDQHGRLIHEFKVRTARRAVSEETARTVARMMRTVITPGGTGVQAALNGYPVCGKTGTAQKIDKEGTYSRDKYIASFVGFTPVEDPAITVLVVIDEPKNQYYGGIIAAPVFKRIAHETLNYLNIPPNREKNPLTVSAGNEVRG